MNMPLKSYKCGECGRSAPKELLRHNRFEDRIAWLRKHYERNHPSQFKNWSRR